MYSSQAVSYTHLDVYKRQIHRSQSSLPAYYLLTKLTLFDVKWESYCFCKILQEIALIILFLL